MLWHFLYSLWESYLHPLTVCHTVSVASPQSAQWCPRCLIYAVLDRICSQTLFLRSEDKALCYLLFKTTFWSHIQDILSGYLVPPLSFSSFSTEDSILQQGSSPSLKPSAASTPCYSSGNHARICFISFFTYSSTPIHLPLPSSADTFWHRYWCLDWCPSVLVLLSKLTSSSTVLSAIPAL